MSPPLSSPSPSSPCSSMFIHQRDAPSDAPSTYAPSTSPRRTRLRHTLAFDIRSPRWYATTRLWHSISQAGMRARRGALSSVLTFDVHSLDADDGLHPSTSGNNTAPSVWPWTLITLLVCTSSFQSPSNHEANTASFLFSCVTTALSPTSILIDVCDDALSLRYDTHFFAPSIRYALLNKALPGNTLLRLLCVDASHSCCFTQFHRYTPVI